MDAVIIWLILASPLLGGYLWYVALIRRRNRAQEALSSVDVQLRKRHDVIPNVLALAKRFMEHEQSLLSEVTELRSRAAAPYDKRDPGEVEGHLEAEKQLQGALRQLFAVSEAYPELRSAETIQNAQNTYREVEGNVSAARRYYNASVTRLNNAVQIFPGNLIAGIVGIRAMPFFELEEASLREPVSAVEHLG